MTITKEQALEAVDAIDFLLSHAAVDTLRQFIEQQPGQDDKDAQRYRWLRRGDVDLSPLYRTDVDESSMLCGDLLDAAVDAALQSEGKRHD